MSLDLTNGNMLDVSPIVERKSNLVTLTSTRKPIVPRTLAIKRPTGISVAPTLATNVGTGVTSTGISIPRTASPTAIQALSTQTETATLSSPTTTPTSSTTTQTPTPSPTPKPTPTTTTSGGGGGGGGAKSEPIDETKKDADETKSTEKTDGTTTTTTTPVSPANTVTPKEKVNIFKEYWFYGILVGGVVGYFFAKNKNANLLTYALLGAGVGGGLGLVAKKMMKPISTSPKTLGDGTVGTKEGTTTLNSLDNDLVNKLIENTKYTLGALMTALGGTTNTQGNVKDLEKEMETKIAEMKPELVSVVSKLLTENEKKAMSEYLDFENNLYKNKKDMEKELPALENKKNEINKKYSVNLDEIKTKLQPK